MNKAILFFLFGLFFTSSTSCQNIHSEKPNTVQEEKTIDRVSKIDEIPVPEGYERQSLPTSSFAYFLRRLPIDTVDNVVHLYNGAVKQNQDAHAYILAVSVGERDLQQCADAVIRLRAEYFFQNDKKNEIHFNLTNGESVTFRTYMEGYRPQIVNDKIQWKKSVDSGGNRQVFESYLNFIYSYAGTYSLSKELAEQSIQDLKIGDVFIKGGFPGHAVIVVDVAENEAGKKIFLLAQSYMPAQEIHILKNPIDTDLSPWYEIPEGINLRTPEWSFDINQLKQFTQ